MYTNEEVIMDSSFLIECIGYLGSFLVLVSFLMTSVVKLRIVNTIGSIIFMVYALIIRSYPTALMNLCLVLINLHILWKMGNAGKEYEITRVEHDDAFLEYLLNRYHDDIKLCFPGIAYSFDDADYYYIITCEGKPVGLVIGKGDKAELELLLDDTIPEFRDFSIGRFMVNRFTSDGFRKLVYRGPDVNHKKYLDKMGYVKTEEGYVKEL